MQILDWLIGKRPRPVDSTTAVPDTTLDLLYQEARRALDSQQTRISSIETKASYFLTTATLIVGLQGLPGAATLLPRDQIWTAIALAIYLALIGAVIQAYRPRGDAPALNPREFLQYPAEDPTFTKQQLLITMMIVHEENITTEVAKRRWLERAQWLLITEAVYLIGVAITRSQWENVSGIVEALTG